MSIDASLVIPTYNRGKSLEICLNCLSRQDYPADRYEIVVADDGSTDDTERIVRGLKAPCEVRYIRQPERLGPGAARNAGVRAAQGEIIIFVDDDVFTPPWFVAEHVKSHRENSNCIVDGPAIDVRGEAQLLNPTVVSRRMRFLASLGFWGLEFVTSNASCRKDDLIRVGGFDETFLRWQDQELWQRLRRAGLHRVRNRTAYALHHRPGGSSLVNQAQARKKHAHYAALFYQKYPSPWAERKARLRYLRYDRLAARLGWLKHFDTPESVASLERKRGPVAALYRKTYLIHAYAEGLKEVLGDPGPEQRS